MSGPKISVYTLTGRAKAIVFGQVQCEQQSLACAAQTQSILKYLLSSSVDFSQQIANIQLLIRRTGNGVEQIEKITQLKNTLKKEAQEIQRELNANMPRVSTKHLISEEAYAAKQAQLKMLQSLLIRAQNMKNAIDTALAQNNSISSQIQTDILRDLEYVSFNNEDESDSGLLKRRNNKNVREIQKNIADDLSGIYSFDLIDDPVVQDTSFDDRKTTINKTLSAFLRDDSLPAKILADIKQAILKLQTITEMQNLTAFDAITVKGLFKKIEAYGHELERRRKEYETLLAHYYALCEMAGEAAKDYSFSEDSQSSEVNGEIERLETSLLRQQEQAYISDCINEVMSEMGYDLIGVREVQKKSGKRFHNELFTFNEGTAVNITYSPDGQISMELGGMAREDRIPTEEETGILTREMETFCGEFAEFECRMRERGIVVGNRVALSPASAEYASIINVSDYDVRENVHISEINAKEKRRRASEKKVMRRDK